MDVAIALIGWQLSVILARHIPPKKYPVLKLPTLDEIKQMKKEAYRRFGEAINRQKQLFEYMARHR